MRKGEKQGERRGNRKIDRKRGRDRKREREQKRKGERKRQAGRQADKQASRQAGTQIYDNFCIALSYSYYSNIDFILHSFMNHHKRTCVWMCVQFAYKYMEYMYCPCLYYMRESCILQG